MGAPLKIQGHSRSFPHRGRMVCALLLFLPCLLGAAPPSPVAYDMERAKEICDSAALSAPEGIWLYPDDNVTVLVLRKDISSPSALPEFELSVIETTDVSLRPGERIGSLHSTADPRKFTMRLFTDRRKGVLSKPESCIVTLGNDSETLMLPKKKKSKLRIRYSLNPASLLPKMWRIVRFGISSGNGTDNEQAPVGLVKIYPSYDGNGSSKRDIRYL